MTKIDWKAENDDTNRIARGFYEAYTANSDNLNFRGEQCPPWDVLTDGVKSHWCAVVVAARDHLLKPT